MAKTMVQECFLQIGDRFDNITRSLKRNYLPYDAEVEYVTFPVGSYVMSNITLINCNNFVRFNVRITDQITPQNRFIFGTWDETNSKSIQFWVDNNTNGAGAMNFGGTISNKSITLNTFENFGINGPLFQIGNVYYNTSVNTSSISTLNFCIGGAILNTGAVEHCTVQFDLSLGIVSNNNNCSYFIPVRVNSVGYLYDKISGELFSSATEVPLIPGPDKS